MGFELNRIMKQYGVSTPGMANYSGAEAPGGQPKAPDAPTITGLPANRPSGLISGVAYDALKGANKEAADKYNADLTKYNTDKAAWDETMRKYQLDTKSYDTYKSDYQNRLQNTPMYVQSQFDTGNRPVSAAMNHVMSATKNAATGEGIGLEQYQQNIRNYIAEHPYASTQANQDAMKKSGTSGQDLFNATGSYWGNQAQNPTYGSFPVSQGNQSLQNKADYYLQQRGIGYTDADLRAAANKNFGEQTDSSWGSILNAAYPKYSQNVTDAYKSIGRTGFGTNPGQIDNSGFNYWMNQLSTGAIKPEDLNPTFAKIAADEKAAADAKAKATTVSAMNTGSPTLITAPVVKAPAFETAATDAIDYNTGYAHGGPVKTHYQTAGAVTLPSGYSDSDNETEWKNRWASQQQPVEVNQVTSPNLPSPVTTEAPKVAEVTAPTSALTEIAAKTAKRDFEPVAPAVVAQVTPAAVKPPVPFGDERLGNIQALLAAYGPKDSAYDAELKTARAAAKAESDAFAKMLTGAMNSPEDEKSSKAEMYFRLAAAFGAPTKTGQFAENLSMVGKELGEYAKSKRASSQQKLALALEGQKMKMSAAKEDLNTLRALAGEEMKDKRTIATELIKDYIKSGEPQSAAGKQAVDEGLKPGTPEYQKRVAAIGNMNVEGKMAQINATLANLSIAQANLALRQQTAAKLSGPELTMKRETEDTVATIKQSLGDLKQAYALNPNSLAGGWMDKSQQWLSEAAGSKDPTIVNTRILNNLLGAQGLAKLKTTFGGNPTEGERAILLELEGIGSKTKEERGAIIRRTYKVLQDKQAREQKRLDDINSGAYRQTSPIEGGSE